MTTRKGQHHLARSREKIKSARILDRLIAFFCDQDCPITGAKAGEWKLTGEQVRVGLKLIDKFIPDLKAIETTINDRRSITSKDDIDLRLRSMGFSEDEIQNAWGRAANTLQ